MSVSEHLSRPILLSVENQNEAMHRILAIHLANSQREKIRAHRIAGNTMAFAVFNIVSS